MKIFQSLLLCLLAISLNAQSIPFNINYQAIARDANGVPFQNADIYAEINILAGSEDGPSVYSESHYTATNNFGLYLLQIGEGDGSDDLRNIDWSANEYFIESNISINGGQFITGASRINAVPYAFVAERSMVDKTEDADSDPANEIQEISLNGTELSLSNSNTVDLQNMVDLEIEESLTQLIFNSFTNQLEYTDEEGTINSIDMSPLKDELTETVTQIGLSSDNQWINYIDEEDVTTSLYLGSAVDATETVTELIFKSNTNHLEYIDEDGTINVIDLSPLKQDVNETVTQIRLSTNNQDVVYKDENGHSTSLNLCAAVDSCETVTQISFNTMSDELIYKDENGNTNAVSVPGLVSDFADLNNSASKQSIASFKTSHGNPVDIKETVTTLKDNGDGSYTYTSEDGSTTLLTRAGISIAEDTEAQLLINGDESEAIEMNSFKELDPEDESKLISYAALSGPEQAVFERGTSQLLNGEIYITFSDHFSKLIEANTITVSLTPHESNTFGLAVIEKSSHGIKVKELMEGSSNFTFDWEVKATRSSQMSYQVIRER